MNAVDRSKPTNGITASHIPFLNQFPVPFDIGSKPRKFVGVNQLSVLSERVQHKESSPGNPAIANIPRSD